jgi:uncharacterized protein
MKSSLPVTVLLTLAACNGSAGAGDPGGLGIADVQGDSAASPLEGRTVTIAGVVTGDFQDKDADVSNNLGGFFVQAEFPDAKAMTSEGVFVFDDNEPLVDVAVGDLVSVTGVVKEYYGETQIAASSVTVIGVGSVTATNIMLPASGVTNNSDGQAIADLEMYEGMLVRFEQTLTVSGLYSIERFGEVTLSVGGRLVTFANGNSPGVDEYAAHLAANAARSIVLDDGRRGQNGVPVRYLHSVDSPDEPVRVGSTAAGLTGVLRYSRGSGGNGTETWRLMATVDPVFLADNPRPGAPDIDGELRIASFNARNFFSTIDSGQDICGPSAGSNCRGADSEEELVRQLAKTTTALSMIDADVVGLIELENNASESLQSIVDSLNATMGPDTYSFVDTGLIGSDAIKNGFIYKPATATPSGPHKIITSQIDERFVDGRNRPTLAQSFVQNSNGAKLTIVVNHLKSKGSSCERDDDPNVGDGQSNCNQTRTAAAKAIADWLKTDPTGSNDPDFLIIGDLNADIKEDPLTAFANAGFINLAEVSRDAAFYSYIFRAQSGALDHALISKSLLPQVAETIEWHINADEAPIHDYNLERDRDASIFDGASPYRSSDHDPIIIGLNLRN